MKNLMDALITKTGCRRGAVLPLVAVLMLVLIGVSALAIDFGHLYVVRNELQNAADAGALRGARVLYNDDGTAINAAFAMQEAEDAAKENKALAEEGDIEVDVEVNGNTGDVQIGHWFFSTKTFQPAADLAAVAPVDLWGVSMEELDANQNFINAVQVVARRGGGEGDSPAACFFGRIFCF
jgi:Flp pilus assembly protein TadG